VLKKVINSLLCSNILFWCKANFKCA